MPATVGTPGLKHVLKAFMDGAMNDLFVAFPATIKSYDHVNQVADLVPAVRRLVDNGIDETADAVTEELPTLPSVPVMQFKGNGFYLHFPLTVGDEVLCIAMDRDASEWRRTGDVSNPKDQRLHSLAHCVCIPALQSTGNKMTEADATRITMGKEGSVKLTITDNQFWFGGFTDAAAVASKVAQLETTFNNHAHAETGGNTGLPLVPSNIGDFSSVFLKTGD